MSASKQFEQQIARIHELLESSGSEVTWDDHIPDPDNPKQPRQIDITIKKDEKLTVVECRIHKSPQNVKWIEELMGRRISLRANNIIAVSSSGFTKGARSKAATYGIMLRDFRKLTDEEILNWHRAVSLTLLFYQYSDICIQFFFDMESLQKIEPMSFARAVKSAPILVFLFNAAGSLLQKLGIDPQVNWPTGFRVTVEPQEDVYIAGQMVCEVELHATARLISRKITCPAVRTYDSPEIISTDRKVVIEQFGLGDTSIVHEGRRVSILLDLSVIDMAPLTQFRYCRTTGEQGMDFERFELRGFDALGVPQGRMEFIAGCYVDPDLLDELPPTVTINVDSEVP